MNLWIALPLGLLGLVAVVEIVARAVATVVALPIFERKPALNARTDAPEPEAEAVTLRTSDGVRLAASVLPREDGATPPRGLVVFCPEYGGSRWSAAHYAAGLREAGFDVFTFDFRNHGDSEHVEGYAPSHWVGEPEVFDADAAISAAAHRASASGVPLVLFGVSRGGSTALVSAARHRSVAAVIAECVPSVDPMMLHYAVKWAELYVPKWFARAIPDWHMAQTMKIVRRVSSLRRGARIVPVEPSLKKISPRPCLLIAGERDTYIPLSLLKSIRRQIGPSCRLWVAPRARHNLARNADEAEYDRRLVRFVSTAVGSETDADAKTKTPTTEPVAGA